MKVAGAKQSLLWKMIIYSLVMLVTGYWGEVVDPGNAAAWGFASGCFFLIVYEIWIGEAAKLAKLPVETLAAHKILCWFVLVGWAIYPLGYMLGTDGWYTGLVGKEALMQFTSLMLSTKWVCSNLYSCCEIANELIKTIFICSLKPS
jgi:hypothetical protein